MGRSQAYRVINAYQVVNNLSPIGGKLPVNESQVRPLAKLTPLEQRAAWQRFLATGEELTALNIKTFVRSQKRPYKNDPEDLTDVISDAYMDAVFAMIEQVRIAQHEPLAEDLSPGSSPVESGHTGEDFGKGAGQWIT